MLLNIENISAFSCSNSINIFYVFLEHFIQEILQRLVLHIAICHQIFAMLQKLIVRKLSEDLEDLQRLLQGLDCSGNFYRLEWLGQSCVIVQPLYIGNNNFNIAINLQSLGMKNDVECNFDSVIKSFISRSKWGGTYQNYFTSNFLKNISVPVPGPWYPATLDRFIILY